MPDKPIKRSVLFNILRPWIQGLFFLMFIYVVVHLSYPYTEKLIDKSFFTVDPLVTTIMVITGTIITSALIGTISIILLTLVFGRFFCGYICPLGALFDFSAMFFPKHRQSKPFGNGSFRNIKYYILTFLLTGALFGFTAILFFDPIVLLYRTFAVNITPFVLIILNWCINIIRPLAMKFGWYEISMISFDQPVFAFGLANLILFIILIGLIGVERRFWCRNLCPLGATFAVFSRFSIRSRKVADTCINCGLCVQTCPMNAISQDYRDTSSRECIQCERCTAACPVGAIAFNMSSPEATFDYNPSRRGMIVTSVAGLTTAIAARSAVSTKTHHGALLRPPGALVEDDFIDVCLRCGKCMKVCPTHALQPAGFQSGMEGIYTPVLTPRIGACEELCNLCGQVCPTGAIRKLPLEEKQYATIGNANIERSRCIAWEQGKVCLICDEVCPYDAVEFHVVTDQVGSIKRPFVIEDKCVGCGQCEQGCPVNGPAAIRVTPVNEVRLNEGSYITEEKRRLREVSDEYQDFSHERGAVTEESYPDQITNDNESSSDMPEGFNNAPEMPEGFSF